MDEAEHEHGLRVTLRLVEDDEVGTVFEGRIRVCRCFRAAETARRQSISHGDAPLLRAFARAARVAGVGFAEDRAAGEAGDGATAE